MSLLSIALLLFVVQPPAPAEMDAGFQARLYLSHETLQPGSDAELAVELTVASGWHIYHPITIDTGLPTTIEFEAPPGVSVGAARFPQPILGRESAEGLTQEYLALEGRTVVLAPVHVDATAAPGSGKIVARVRALACKKLCVPAAAEPELSVTISPAAPAPANARLFEEARSALPPALERAEYLEGSRLLVSHTRVPVGGTATIVAAIRVKPGHHIQDREPGLEGMIPARLFLEPIAGIKLGPQVWPRAKARTLPGVGRVREQSGEFLIQVPFEVIDTQFKTGPVKLRALLQYQACNDAGTCFPPAMAEASVTFDVVAAGETAVRSEDPILARLASAAEPIAAPTTQGAEVSTSGAAGGPAQPGLLAILLGAFIGGVILNIMPCVLPVISLKVFGFVQQAHDDRGRIFRMGLMYTVGILASFLVLAILMVYAGLAWGGLMQRPGFLIGLTAVVFAFALSLLGVYEINLPGAAMSAAGEAATREGYSGAFLNGVLATLLATPCVAPFLGSAIGALTRLPNPFIAGAGIMLVGVGLALPYLLLTAFPGWLRYLPKPGPWMVTFKQIVGFILVVVVLWLLSILATMVDTNKLLAALGLLTAVALGCWVIGRITLMDSTGRWARLWLTAILLTAGGAWASFRVFSEHTSRIAWQPWEPGIAQRLAAEGYTVYVDYTATWCLTCQANKKLVLETEDIAGEFKRLGIYPVKADFTQFDPRIQKELLAHGRNGVPLNIVVPAHRPDDVSVLPEVLTRSIVRDALHRAGPSLAEPPFPK